MLLTGDISIPDKGYSEQLDRQLSRYPEIFTGQPLICNLEGLVCDADMTTAYNSPVLYNHSSVLFVLKRHGCRAVCLSNNHALDLPGEYDATMNSLKAVGIAHAGIGISMADAMKPAEFNHGDKKIFVFNSAWHVLLQHRKNPSQGVFIDTIDEDRIIRQVSKYRSAYPDSAIVVCLHWNFDLETLPFPVHRKFARSLIDNGAGLVVGSHSHCVQGGERYKNGYIAYGLGNFFIPWNTYINGKIRFPEFARIEMVLEWDPDTGSAKSHFFRYDNEFHNLELEDSQSFDGSEMLKSYSPYRELSGKEYPAFFRKHRRKRWCVPVFTRYNDHFITKLQSEFTIWRIRIARLLARLKLREWNN